MSTLENMSSEFNQSESIETKEQNNYQQDRLKLNIRLTEVESLAFLAKKNSSLMPLLFSILQLILIVSMTIISFYFTYTQDNEFREFFSLVFTVFLILIYFAYLDMKDTYFKFQKKRQLVIEIESIRYRIVKLIKLYDTVDDER